VSFGGLYAASNATVDGSWLVKGFLDDHAPENAVVTATARSPSNLDVFFSAGDGNVYDTYWSAPAGWSTASYNVTSATCYNASFAASTNGAPCVGSAAMGGGIAAVSLHPWNINVFYIGNDGGIWNSFWEGSNWSTWEILGPSSGVNPSAGVAPPGGGITAIARSSTSIDLYFIANDGSLQTMDWTSTGSWAHFTLGPTATGVPGSPISAVARQPGTADVIFEGAAGASHAIEWASWQSPATTYTIQPIPGTAGQTPDQQGTNAVSLVAPTSFSLQAFYLNTQGSLATAAWQDPSQCNPTASVPCDSTPTEFPWGSVQVAPAQ
jgi:hypothetical protein